MASIDMLLEERTVRLAQLFRRVVRLGLPPLALGLAACGDCPNHDDLFVLRDPDAETQALIESCRQASKNGMDGKAVCLPLCTQFAERNSEFPHGRTDGIVHCELHPDKDGLAQLHVIWQSYCPGGRRPERLALAQAAGSKSLVGEALAEMAQLEAASVPAFRRLARELGAHGAPLALVEAAKRAARDEVRHARIATALARRHGAAPGRPRVPRLKLRSIEEVAAENAREGCVRERWGALIATHQAGAATDPLIRAGMAVIARDETRHAALADLVALWCHERLTPAARTRVAESAAAARAELERGLTTELPGDAEAILGLPSATLARRMLASSGDASGDRASAA
jgi:hypothetical protein